MRLCGGRVMCLRAAPVRSRHELLTLRACACVCVCAGLERFRDAFTAFAKLGSTYAELEGLKQARALRRRAQCSVGLVCLPARSVRGG
jgi:hypothetical protein